MALTERKDRETLLVMGRWLGVGRVGVLKGPEWEVALALGGGVEGRAAAGLRKRASRSSSLFIVSSSCVTATFSFSAAISLFCLDSVIVTILTLTSPSTFDGLGFLGEGKRTRLVFPRCTSPMSRSI